MYRCLVRAIPLGFTAAFLPLALAQAAMFTPGQLVVNSTGAATYTVPLQVPPGTAGMQPMLALAYNSQSGNGIAGMGWSIGGQSTITRCPQTMAQDGVSGSINYDANDRFCLDGERLIVASGAYGANATEYRTEKETFAKITSYGAAGTGPLWFKVWTKSGQIIEYGNSTDSRVIATGKTTAALWAMNRTQDVKGNYLIATYTRDIDFGDVYPARIDYTGNSATGTAPSASVQFQYELRPDAVPYYQAGSVFKNRVRLAKVQTYVGTTKVKEYRLGYDISPATKRSRLTILAECDGVGAGTCLPSSNFAWQGDANMALTLAATLGLGLTDSTEFNNGTRIFSADFDGDGKSDFLSRRGWDGSVNTFVTDGPYRTSQLDVSDNDGYNSPLRLFIADVNGDGKMDVVSRTAAGVFRTNLFEGSPAFKPAIESPLGLSDAQGWGTGTRYFIMDVNGDGRTDLVARYYTGALMTYLSNGTTFVPAQLSSVDQSDGKGWDTGLRYFPMDVNGDGKMDLVTRDAVGDFTSYLSNGAGFVASGVSQLGLSDANGWNSGFRYFTLDVNGDGKTDLVTRDIGGNFTTYLSNGYTFVSAGVTSFPGHTDAGGWNSGHRYFLMDVNGDGLTDIVARYVSGDFEVFASNGVSFSSAGIFPLGLTDAGGWNEGVRYFMADMNGDGKTELIARGADGSMRIYQSTTAAPDLMVRVVNGLQSETKIVYSALSQSSSLPQTDPKNVWYTKDTDAVYPIRDVQPALYVVTSIADANGANGQIATNYTYGGLKNDLSGRGSLGFRWIKSVQQETGVTTLTENRQDWPYTGLTAKVTTSLAGSGSDGTLRAVYNNYGCIGYDGAVSSASCAVSPGRRYFAFLNGSAEAGADLNGATLGAINKGWQYDAYGNITQSTMTTSDGYSERTENTYINDIPNWFLGRLTRSTNYKQTP